MGCSDLPGRARWVVWPCLCFLATENARKAFPSHSHGLPTCTMDLAWTPQSGPSWLCPPLPLDSSTLQSLRLRSATPGEGGGPGLSVANSSRARRGGFCQDLWLSGHWSTPGLQAWPAPLVLRNQLQWHFLCFQKYFCPSVCCGCGCLSYHPHQQPHLFRPWG